MEDASEVAGPKSTLLVKLTDADGAVQHSVVGVQAVKRHRDAQDDENKIMLLDLLVQPEDFVAAIERYSCSIASIVGWGRRIHKMNDPLA
jgi:hypothetical protein